MSLSIFLSQTSSKNLRKLILYCPISLFYFKTSSLSFSISFFSITSNRFFQFLEILRNPSGASIFSLISIKFFFSSLMSSRAKACRYSKQNWLTSSSQSKNNGFSSFFSFSILFYNISLSLGFLFSRNTSLDFSSILLRIYFKTSKYY